jgi:hypothetical protein
MKGNQGARLLAYVTGLVNQELLLQNEYLAAENRILRAHFPARLRLSDPERRTLAEIGKRLGRKALAKVAYVSPNQTPSSPGTGASSPASSMVRNPLTIRGYAEMSDYVLQHIVTPMCCREKCAAETPPAIRAPRIQWSW